MNTDMELYLTLTKKQEDKEMKTSTLRSTNSDSQSNIRS